VDDVRVAGSELFGDRRRFTAEEQDGTVNGIGQRAAQDELTAIAGRLGIGEVLGT
jgi:hypothetical protein